MHLTEEPIVDETVPPFVDGEFMCGLEFGCFVLELYQLNDSGSGSHQNIGYRFWDREWQPGYIFETRELGVPRGYCIDDPFVFSVALGYISLKPGDTDSDFFDSYTSRQTEWCAEKAEEVSYYQSDLEEMHSSIWNKETPSWACKQYEHDTHTWLDCPDCQANWQVQHEWQEHTASRLYLAPPNSRAVVSVPVLIQLNIPISADLKQVPDARKLLQEQIVAWVIQATEFGLKPQQLEMQIDMLQLEVKHVMTADKVTEPQAFIEPRPVKMTTFDDLVQQVKDIKFEQ